MIYQNYYSIFVSTKTVSKEIMNITKQVLEILNEEGRKEAYLFNNKLLFGNFIKADQYNFNHSFISKLKK